MREVCVGLNAFRASLAGVLRRVVMPAFMHILLPVFMLGLGLGASGSAAALTLNAQQGLQRSASLAGELAVFMDPSGTLDIEAIAALPLQHAFVPLQGQLASGHTDSAVWLRFTLARDTNAPSAWLLEATPTYLDLLTLYAAPSGALPADGSPRYTAMQLGDLVNFSERQLHDQRFLFALQLDTNPRTYFLRVQTSSPARVQLRLWQPDGLERFDALDHLSMGVLLGATLAILFFNLALGIWVKKEIHFYYAGWIASFILLLIFNEGYAAVWFFPSHAWLADAGVGAATSLHNVLATLFLGKLFEFEKNWPPAWRFFKAVAVFNAVGVLFALAGFYPLIDQWIVWGALVSTSFGIAFSTLLLMRGRKEYWVPMLSFAPLTISNVIIIIASKASYDLGLNDVTSTLFRGASVMQLVILNVALAQRLRKAESSYVYQAQASLQRFARSERLLQTRVHQRTDSLARVNARLQDEAQQQALLHNKLGASLAAEQQALAQQRQFMSMVAHEFRNPLAVISAAAQSLELSRLADDSVLLLRIQKIQRGVRRLVVLVENFLVEDRMVWGSLKMFPRRQELHALAHSAIQVFTPAAAQRMVLAPAAGSTFVLADHFLLTVALTNLLQNALKYSPPNSLIHLQVETLNGMAQLRVQDQGAGIAVENQSLVFEKFSHFDTPYAPAGVGLGLYLAHQIAVRHDGDVLLLQSSPSGSVVALQLPLAL